MRTARSTRSLLLRFTATAALVAGGCATNPVTGERQLALISEGQEIELGRQSAQQVEQTIGLVDDAALQSYVSRIGNAMAAASERPDLPWRFGVVDDPTPNAFALPGGFIYITRGLMNVMDSEAELATVLGHEIGHVTARHSVTAISRAQLAQLGLGIGTILLPELQGLGNLAGAGLQLLFLRYGRDAEHQADELGFRYALQQNYDVREMPDVFATLARIGEAEGQSPLPSWLSTHPYPEERIERTQQRLAQLQQPPANLRSDRAAYLGRIDGLVYGENPRHGYFQGSLFLHPDLRFRLEFPQGWTNRNLSQVVLAASPAQDAVIQLTLTAGDPAQAAQQFLAQQGITAGPASRETVNGLPAAAAYFEAQTEQGLLRGLAFFVSHGGNTYQLLGYSPAARFSTYDAVFRRSMSSFAPLTDARALAVQPNRVDIVQAPAATTLAEFNRRYPSVVPIEELALINQLADASSRIPAGTLVKRVVAGTG